MGAVEGAVGVMAVNLGIAVTLRLVAVGLVHWQTVPDDAVISGGESLAEADETALHDVVGRLECGTFRPGR